MIYDLQRASMWKRLSAYLFDTILVGILAVGIALLLSTLLGYDRYAAQMDSAYDRYAAEYGVSFDLTSAEYEALSQEEQVKYDAATRALFSDDEVRYAYTMMINLTLLITTFGLLFAFLILEFLVPLLFKNGQTLGKKAFGIAVMRFDGVKIGTPILFVRTVLGKYTLETMIPVLLLIMLYFGFIGGLGLIVIGVILLAQVVLVATTRTRTPLHDLIANTVTVDMASQMIFESKEEMLAYKKRIHAEGSIGKEY